MFGDKDVLKNRQVGEKTDVLEGTGNAQLCYLVGRLFYDFFVFSGVFALVLVYHLSLGMIFDYYVAVKGDKTVRRLINSGNAVESRCLSGSVRPDESDDLVFVYVQRKVVNGNNAAELHGHVFDMKHIFSHYSSPPVSFAERFLENAAGIRLNSRPRPSQENSFVPMIPLR